MLLRALGGHRWLVTFLVVATLVVIVPWFHAPLSFDEAYNLQVVRNLLRGNGYATDGTLQGGHLTPFDYRITTGPTVLLPTAGTAAILGEHLWVYRLVPVLVSAGLVAAWGALVRRHWGLVPGVAAGAAVLMIDNASFLQVQRFGPGTVLGENASVLFLILAAFVLRRPSASGLLVGLAIMTKVIVALAIPGMLLGLLLLARRGADSRPAPMWRFVVAGLLPALAWQVYRVMAVGPAAAWGADRDFLSFLAGTGGSTTASATLPERIFGQVAVLGVAGVTALLLVLLVLVAAAHRDRFRGLFMWPPELIAVAVAGGTLEMWWLFLEGQGWVRHSAQATALLAPLLAASAARVLSRPPRTALRDVLSISLPLLVIAQVAVAAVHGVRPPGPSLEDQRLVAEHVARLSPVFLMPSIPQDLELTMMASVKEVPDQGQGGILVLSGMRGPQTATRPCRSILYEHAGYVVCRVDPAH